MRFNPYHGSVGDVCTNGAPRDPRKVRTVAQRQGPLIRSLTPLLAATLVTAAMLAACAATGEPKPTAAPTAQTASPSPELTSEPDGSPAPESTATPSAQQTSTPTPRSSQKPSPKPKKRTTNVIDWLLDLGVTAPEGPTTPKDEAFKSLSRQSCTPINPAFAVLEATAAACRAAQNGNKSTDWDHARHIRDTTDRSSLDCKDRMALALLDALVQSHLDHPNLPFRFKSGNGLVRQQCLTVTSIKPRVAFNGDLVTVRGHNLNHATRVELFVTDGSSPATASIVNRGQSQLRLRIPDHAERTGHSIIISWKDNNTTTRTWARLQFGPRPQTASPTPSNQPGPNGEESHSPTGGDEGQTTPGPEGDQ